MGNKVMDAALRERASIIRLLVLDVDGVMTDNRIHFDADGRESKSFNARDGLGIKVLQRTGIEVAVITGRVSEPVTRRMDELGVRHVYQGCERKLDAFLELLEITGLDPRQVCFAGDDWIDIPILMRAGLAVTVPNAEDRVREYAHWVTSRNGGEGAVREVCNLLLDAQDKTQAVLDVILTP